MSLSIQQYGADEARHYLSDLARLRIAVFREYPYLYDGTQEYEEKYLQTVLSAPQSVVVIVRDGEQVVGASTALPMQYETANVQAPWREAGIAIEEIFYYGESVLLPAYRGAGLGVRFFEEREAWARRQGGYRLATFCAVVRPSDHPRRPADYLPLDRFWQKRGFEPTDRYCYMSWQDLDEEQESRKRLRFWQKELRLESER